jgi:hypothetical protein
MDDELQALEAELSRLRPLAPSPELSARVGRELGPRGRLIPLWSWIALPTAAAAAAALIILGARPASGAAPAAAFKPVSAQQVLLSASDEGYVQLGDGTPAHRFRASYVDTITWEDPQSHASLRWSVPRDEVRVIPASFQ